MQEEQKYTELKKLLTSQGVIEGEKLVIFTEHKDTLLYLQERLSNNGYHVAIIHGGMSVDERRESQCRFMTPDIQILICTDAAGEGINLQFCRLLINWDIPWNPNRLEQRMGRIHRYGQKSDVIVFNMVAGNTREGVVLEKLLTKLDIIREQLGDDRVYDVIQDVLKGISLNSIISSVLNGQENELDIFVDRNTDELGNLFQESINNKNNEIAHSTVDYKDARQLKDDSDEKRLQPIYIRLFFERAFKHLGGQFREIADNIFQITYIPDIIVQKLKELYQSGVLIIREPYLYDDFSDYGLERDVVVPENVAWTHRRGEEADIYFIANQKENEAQEFVASFRIKDMKPELWNPMTGEISEPLVWKKNGDRIEVELSLDAAESMFVVFRKPLVEGEGQAVAQSIRRIPFDVKEWNVHFNTLNKDIQLTALTDWTKSADEQIRYYSGTAVYKSEFKWNPGKSEEGSRIYLELGELHDVALVRINGKVCGIVWTAPYEVEVTGVLEKGKNTIEIEVVNTWANALLGSDTGKAPFSGIWTNAKYRRADKELIPAGLVGPLKWKLVK